MENSNFTIVLVTGLNGFQFFVGLNSVFHDYMKKMKGEGVVCEIVKSNLNNFDAMGHSENLKISSESFDVSKLATTEQQWRLGRYYNNNYRSPINPTPNIHKKHCA